jgi:hypothetical protein
VYILILILSALRKNRDSNFAVVSRIFTTYMQIVSFTMGFNITLPQFLYDAASPVSSISPDTTTIMSFDCFFKNYNFELFSKSIQIFKILLLAFLPFLLVTLSTLVWFMIALVKRKFWREHVR